MHYAVSQFFSQKQFFLFSAKFNYSDLIIHDTEKIMHQKRYVVSGL